MGLNEMIDVHKKHTFSSIQMLLWACVIENSTVESDLDSPNEVPEHPFSPRSPFAPESPLESDKLKNLTLSNLLIFLH